MLAASQRLASTSKCAACVSAATATRQNGSGSRTLVTLLNVSSSPALKAPRPQPASSRRSISSLPASTHARTSGYRASVLARVPQLGHQVQRRGMMLRASEPSEPPEDTLETAPELNVTESALAQIARAQDRAKGHDVALRVAVESGGCHGYQYKMEVTREIDPTDYVFSHGTARLVVDPSSLSLMSGATIDYTTELIGSQFKIADNPHADDRGGCGCGVSWSLKGDP